MTDRRPTPASRRAAIGLAVATLATLVAVSAGSAQAATITVAAMNYEFKPPTRTVVVGDAIRWTFSGDPHSVTSRDGLFDSGVMSPGGSFEFKFTAAGTFRYYCQVHPEQMFGTIVVESATATPKPTIRPTATSTPKPTVRPTARPAATARPTATQAPAPTAAPAVASPSEPPAPTASVVPSPSPDASLALVATPAPSIAAASPAPGLVTPSSTTDATPIVAAVALLVVLVVGGLSLARRRRPI